MIALRRLKKWQWGFRVADSIEKKRCDQGSTAPYILISSGNLCQAINQIAGPMARKAKSGRYPLREFLSTETFNPADPFMEGEGLKRGKRMEQARILLDISEANDQDLIEFRNGARTWAVLATPKSVNHRFRSSYSQVVLKFYKGDGSTPGSLQYQAYHQNWFHRVEALTGNRHVQQSLVAGVRKGVGPYAVLQFIEGEELAEQLRKSDLTKESAGRMLQDILLKIWIPLWAGGLRFKDCHPGNFVVTPEGRTVMIDTEQMRKDAHELLRYPSKWTQRDKHQESGIARVPRLVQRVILATNSAESGVAVLRKVKLALHTSCLVDRLRLLGRGGDNDKPAVAAAQQFLAELRGEGFIT